MDKNIVRAAAFGLLIAVGSSLTSGQWKRIEGSPVNVNSLAPGGSVWYATSAGGTIFKSTDKGESWQTVPPPAHAGSPTYVVQTGKAPYLVSGNLVFSEYDAPFYWCSLYFSGTGFLTEQVASSGNNLYVVNTFRLFFRADGNTQIQPFTRIPSNVRYIFADSNVVFVQDSLALRHSSDFGATWDSLSRAVGVPTSTIAKSPGGYIVKFNGRFGTYSPLTHTLTFTTSDAPSPFAPDHVAGDATLVVMNAGRQVYASVDGGETFTDFTGPDSLWATVSLIQFVEDKCILGTDAGMFERPRSDASLPLPVTLQSFEGARTSDQRVRLHWRTLSEVNNYGFVVQKSRSDRSVFRDVASSFIPGHGSCTTRHEYEYTDDDINDGSCLYRLRQLNLDGSFVYSASILVGPTTEINESAPHEIGLSQNFPNPFNPSTEFTFRLPTRTHARLEIFTALGQSVRLLVNGMYEAGEHRVTFRGESLSSGVYFARLSLAGSTFTRKILLAK